MTDRHTYIRRRRARARNQANARIERIMTVIAAILLASVIFLSGYLFRQITHPERAIEVVRTIDADTGEIVGAVEINHCAQ